MSKMNDDHYFDLDNFDESKSLRSRREREARRRARDERERAQASRRLPQQSQRGNRPRPSSRPSVKSGAASGARPRPLSRSGGQNRRPPGNRRPISPQQIRRNNRRRQRNKNRFIMVGGAFLILLILVILIVTMFKGCGGGKEENKPVSTDTKAKQSEGTQLVDSSLPETLSPYTFNTPVIKDDNTNGMLYGDIYVWNNAGYTLFTGDTTSAGSYSEAVKSVTKKLSKLKIYSMIVPNATEMQLPDRLKSGDAMSSAQSDFIKSAYSTLGKNITAINCYNNLAKHNNEYIYFKSDYRWTGLGAYYAYQAFAESTKSHVVELKDCEELTIEGFTGSYASETEGLDSDTVHYWKLPYVAKMSIVSGEDQVSENLDIYGSYGAGSDTYDVFLNGSNPISIVTSTSMNGDGKSIAVVTDGYGNAMIPFLSNDYHEIHVLDIDSFRSAASSDLAEYCTEKNISEVLFLTSVDTANSQEELQKISGLVD